MKSNKINNCKWRWQWKCQRKECRRGAESRGRNPSLEDQNLGANEYVRRTARKTRKQVREKKAGSASREKSSH